MSDKLKMKSIPRLEADGSVSSIEMPEVEEAEWDAVAYIKSEKKKVTKAFIDSCKAGNPANLKLYFTMIGVVKKDDDDGNKLDAGNLARQALSVIKELEGKGYITVNKWKQHSRQSSEKTESLSSSDASSPPSISPEST